MKHEDAVAWAGNIQERSDLTRREWLHTWWIILAMQFIAGISAAFVIGCITAAFTGFNWGTTTKAILIGSSLVFMVSGFFAWHWWDGKLEEVNKRQTSMYDALQVHLLQPQSEPEYPEVHRTMTSDPDVSAGKFYHLHANLTQQRKIAAHLAKSGGFSGRTLARFFQGNMDSAYVFLNDCVDEKLAKKGEGTTGYNLTDAGRRYFLIDLLSPTPPGEDPLNTSAPGTHTQHTP